MKVLTQLLTMLFASLCLLLPSRLVTVTIFAAIRHGFNVVSGQGDTDAFPADSSSIQFVSGSNDGKDGNENGSDADGRAANSEVIDVQARVISGSVGTYKLDIQWGGMAFEWDSSGRVYDPDTHAWQTADEGNWNVTGHNGVNNKIVCANHSNASLEVAFDVTQTLEGVAYDILQANDRTGESAENLHLSKVPLESESAPKIAAYLLLSGEPSHPLLGFAQNWSKIGTIAVTFTPSTVDTMRTPRR